MRLLAPWLFMSTDFEVYARRRAEHEAAANALALRHPMLRKGPHDGLEICRYWGMDCGTGWVPLIDAAATSIETHCAATGNPLLRVTQVKEKLGTIRIYLNGGDGFADAVADAAKALSGSICERTGRPGLRGRVESGSARWRPTRTCPTKARALAASPRSAFPTTAGRGSPIPSRVPSRLRRQRHPGLDVSGLPVGWLDLVSALLDTLAQRWRSWVGEEVVTITGGRLVAACRGADGNLDAHVEGGDRNLASAVLAFAVKMSNASGVGSNAAVRMILSRLGRREHLFDGRTANRTQDRHGGHWGGTDQEHLMAGRINRVAPSPEGRPDDHPNAWPGLRTRCATRLLRNLASRIRTP